MYKIIIFSSFFTFIKFRNLLHLNFPIY
jgi:hypothetical protein